MPGEEALYKWIGSLLDAAAKDPEVMKTLQETATCGRQGTHHPADVVAQQRSARRQRLDVAGEQRGVWHRLLSPTGAVKADPYDNKRNETMYFYTDNDTQWQQLVGKSSYTVTFPKGKLPPVKGFWSLTMYDPEHFFYPNQLKRYALGTKNKSLKDTTTMAASPSISGTSRLAKRRNPTGSRHRLGTFRSGSVPIGPKRILDGTWKPPVVQKIN